MNRCILVSLVALLAIAGCAKQAAHMEAASGAARPEAPPSPASAASVNRYLAYEHTLTIDAPQEKILPLFDAAQATCREATAESCAILQAQITSGEYASAQLKFRATAKGVLKLIEVLSAQGEVASRSTSAEDLAGPIEDNAKKLAMLNDYRGKLEALRGRSNADVDALIKLTHELAQVQSDIESLSGAQAALVQRVETEILTVSITSFRSRSFWSPIGDATSDFSGDLADAIASFITGVAYLLPWAVLVILAIWIWRKVRRRRS